MARSTPAAACPRAIAAAGVARRPPPAPLGGARRAQSRRRGTCSRTASLLHAVPEAAAAALSLAELQAWEQCSRLVQERCNLEQDAADAALERAFGWRGQAFWRQERVKQAPDAEQVAAALDYLFGILDPADAANVVKSFPEALGLRIGLMAENVSVMQDKWSLKGRLLANALKRKPRVLGNCIDCEGNCAGLCTRCWCQF